MYRHVLKNKNPIILLLFIISLSKCTGNNEDPSETQKMVKQLVGDTLILPENKMVLYDDSLYNKNSLPFDIKTLQTFLLNSNNEIILVGNPIYSEELEKLYKREIEKRIGK